MDDRPIPQTYWIIPGRFLAGQYPGQIPGDLREPRSKLRAFLEAGINTFIDLTREGELAPYLHILQKEAESIEVPIQYTRSAITDRNLPTQEQMKDILERIDSALQSGNNVYVHCWGGIGRTGTVVGCWLVREGLTGREALERLNDLYQNAAQSLVYAHSPETDAQMEFVRSWKEGPE